MRALLGSQDVLEIVEEGYDEPKAKQEEEGLSEALKQQLNSSSKEDWKAKSTIYQGLDEAMFERDYSNFQNGKGSFGKSSTNIQRVKLIVNQHRRNGDTLPDIQVMEKFLRSLDPKFDYVLVAIEESKNFAEMTVETVEKLVGSLQAHEQKLVKRSEEQPLEQALQTKLTLNERSEHLIEDESREFMDAQEVVDVFVLKLLQRHQGNECAPIQNFQIGQGRGCYSRPYIGPRYGKSHIQCHVCQNFGHYAS
ncbi:uncharacterized protein LOC130758725 [Actinidia eriantha]|uniref:uncharacterized protein LOC130758725 n=1 Tax=Actinidia eriantha TaxID=165200 RepID=UPI00258EF710|nr:uncharacterized protein LOC130758725 [Actinidia eriantha]